jgi:putative PIN family toxin of toxin-antitoxin system
VTSHQEIAWIASPDIMDEYLTVLQRKKFGLPAEVVSQWVEMFGRLVTIAEVQDTVIFPHDQKDAIFLACALATSADYFITGDRDFSGARKVGNTTILSASQFTKLFHDEMQ